MIESKPVILVVDRETGSPFPTVMDSLPAPVTATEAGLMIGDPIPEHLRVHHGNWLAWPHCRWAFTHMDELRASAQIAARGPLGDPLLDAGGATNDPGKVSMGSVGVGIGGLDGIVVDNGRGGTWAISEMLHHTYADGFLVAHRGRVEAEWYGDGMDRSTRHIMFSMTKTVTGVLALLAVDEGAMNLDDLLVTYVPELSGSAYEPVTVRQALDMTDGIRFNEDYTDRDSDISRYGVAMSFTPVPRDWDGPVGVRDGILALTEREQPPGEAFAYKSVTTDVLAWATARATDRRWVDGVSDAIWTPMGAEADASVVLDDRGIAVSSGGMSCTLRDLSRFVRMLGRSGRVGDGDRERQAIPRAVADDVAAGGDPSGDIADLYPTRRGWTYHRQCWNARRVLGGFMQMGIHGQRAFCHPESDLVVAYFSSRPVAANVYTDAVFASLVRAVLENS
ncbi:MAG: hypothetical protein CL467_04700 [Acidimicrobiaceae bacterium]|nr:hypothetical protein [Acidimicrobiaceae bacterium]